MPAIDDNGVILADSNAILVYLNTAYNDGYEWMPKDPIKAATVQGWLSVAAGAIASGPCSVRLVHVFGVELDYDLAKQKTDALFAVIEPLLAQQAFLAGEAITLADVSAYTYISHAPKVAPALIATPLYALGLARIEAQPRFVGMLRSAIPAT